MEPDSAKPSDKIVAVPLEDVRRARGETLVAMPRSKVAGLRAFRRIRADRILGALGLVLVIAGVFLIFTWERPPVVEKKFAVEWVPESHDEPSKTATLAAGASQPYTIPVNDVNVTAVSFWLYWKDDVPTQGSDQADGDTFELTVKGPTGTNVSFTERRTGGSAGMNMSYVLPLSGVPDVASVLAGTEKEAREKVGDRTNHTGTGTWTFTVRLVTANASWSNPDLRGTAPNGQCPAAGSPACTPDPGNAFTFGFSYSRYHVEFEKKF